MASSQKHSADLSVRKHKGGESSEKPQQESVERARSSTAREQLAAIAAGIATRTHHYGIKSQPLGQRPPAKEEERPKG